MERDPEPEQSMEDFTFQGTGEGEWHKILGKIQRLGISVSQRNEQGSFIHRYRSGLLLWDSRIQTEVKVNHRCLLINCRANGSHTGSFRSWILKQIDWGTLEKHMLERTLEVNNKEVSSMWYAVESLAVLFVWTRPDTEWCEVFAFLACGDEDLMRIRCVWLRWIQVRVCTLIRGITDRSVTLWHAIACFIYRWQYRGQSSIVRNVITPRIKWILKHHVTLKTEV